MDIGVPGMAGIQGVVMCGHIATNPGSAEQQDFDSLAHHYLLYTSISFHNDIV